MKTDPAACACCAGAEHRTPASTANPPGRPSIAYRAGTHGAFMASMRAALSEHAVLRELTTRDADDAAMALLDAGATVLDVLTFYQERIANEGFLRTATERGSVLELARGIGYELGAGVAASAYLAFTVDDTPGSPESVAVRPGTKAQSVPGQDESAQVFETVEEIEARPEWNAIPARVTRPRTPVLDDTELYLAGTATGLVPGDFVLLVGAERQNDPGNENWDVRRVTEVRPRPSEGPRDPFPDHTVVVLEESLGSAGPEVAPPAAPFVYALRERTALFGHNAMAWHDLPVQLRVGEKVQRATGEPVFEAGPYAGSEHAWADAAFAASTTAVNLDRVVPGLVAGSWLALAKPGVTRPLAVELYRVEEVAEETKSAFLLSAKTTKVRLSGENIQWFSPRTTSALCRSERLALAEEPFAGPVGGRSVRLAAPVPGIAAGRRVVVTGADPATGAEQAELATVYAATGDELRFTADLAQDYVPDSVRVLANVALATHGDSRAEILGSGDGRKAFQTFVLRGTPLTYVTSAAATGAASTLEVRVEGVRWHEVETLYGQPPDARVYVVRHAEDGTASVTFGDGVTGARLPTGADNVLAMYRAGTGLGGQLRAGQLSLLLSRPLGLNAVGNPLPATGAADPESLVDARVTAPTRIRTLDRIVSVRDYEDFARAFGGIGKASAVPLWHGQRRVVHLTIAAADGSVVAPGTPLHANLLAAVDAARHAAQPVRLDAFVPSSFRVRAAVRVDPDLVAADVLEAVRARLLEGFSFARRGFAQDVTSSEVLAAMHGVPGVLAVELDALHTGTVAACHDRLPAYPARMTPLGFRQADLLTADPAGIDLWEMTE